MTYLTIFLLILENTSISGCFTDEAYASAALLLEKISDQETSENSDLTLTIHTNFRISTFPKDFQNGEEPFPHSSPTIIPYRDPLVKTNLSRGSRFGEEPFPLLLTSWGSPSTQQWSIRPCIRDVGPMPHIRRSVLRFPEQSYHCSSVHRHYEPVSLWFLCVWQFP